MDITNLELCKIKDVDPEILNTVYQKFYGLPENADLDAFIDSSSYISKDSDKSAIGVWEVVKPYLLKPAVRKRFLANIHDHNPVIVNLKAFKPELTLDDYFSHGRFSELRIIENAYRILHNYRRFLIIPNRLPKPTGYVVGIMDLVRTIVIEDKTTGYKYCKEAMVEYKTDDDSLTFGGVKYLQEYWESTLYFLSKHHPEVDHSNILVIPTNYTWAISNERFMERLVYTDLGIRNKLFTFHPLYDHSIKKISFL